VTLAGVARGREEKKQGQKMQRGKKEIISFSLLCNAADAFGACFRGRKKLLVFLLLSPDV